MNKQISLGFCPVLSLSAALFAAPTLAAVTNATFLVNVNFVESCRVSATQFAFSKNDDVAARMRDAVAMVSPSCTQGTVYTATVSTGSAVRAAPASNEPNTPDGATMRYGNRTANPSTLFVRVPLARSVRSEPSSDTVTMTLAY